MPKMKVTQADGTITIVEDNLFQKSRYYRYDEFRNFKQRENLIQLILDSLENNDGQTTKELLESTKIPEHYLNRYLIDLEKDKKVTRSGSKHYLNPLEVT